LLLCCRGLYRSSDVNPGNAGDFLGKAPCGFGSAFVISLAMRRSWSRREQIQALVAMVVGMLAFVYFIFFLADPITEWLLEVLGLSD
jgi:hypothetical protein